MKVKKIAAWKEIKLGIVWFPQPAEERMFELAGRMNEIIKYFNKLNELN